MSEDVADEAQLHAVAFAAHTAHVPLAKPDKTLPQRLRCLIAGDRRKVVAIDDDPTGCQTVHDVPLLLEWSVEALCEGLCDPSPLLFVLTNTRAQVSAEAAQTNREVAANLRAAQAHCGISFAVLSRSDSTLRGHFPAETDALASVLGPYDGLILAPCFFEGGRHTLHGVHWVRSGDQLIPAAQTESARDASFGFSHSYLPAWVEEKTAGRVAARDVVRVDLADIRGYGRRSVNQLLETVESGRPVVVDALTYEDLERFVVALLQVEASGRRFLYRTAASFVRVRAGIAERSLLRPSELLAARAGLPGLVAVGSHVPRSTAQLRALLRTGVAAGIELNVPALLEDKGRLAATQTAVRQACSAHDCGRIPVVYTSRELVVGAGPHESLQIGEAVTAALVDVVREIARRRALGWLIVKGGVTSHAVAREALGARRGRVLGQVAAGVPAWTLSADGGGAGVAYVVFPGNVGEEDTLRDLVQAFATHAA